MRICDQCGSPAVGTVYLDPGDEQFDVCQTHLDAVRAVFQQPEPEQEEKRRGRPSKRD